MEIQRQELENRDTEIGVGEQRYSCMGVGEQRYRDRSWRLGDTEIGVGDQEIHLTSRNIGLKDTTPFIQNPLRHEEILKTARFMKGSVLSKVLKVQISKLNSTRVFV